MTNNAVFTDDFMNNPLLSAYASWRRSRNVGSDHSAMTDLWTQRGFHVQGSGRDWKIDPQNPDKRLVLSNGQKIDNDWVFVEPYQESWLTFQVRSDKIIVHGFEQSDADNQESVLATMISHANQTWDKRCQVSGTSNFQLQMWKEAYRQGVEITNFTPPKEVVARVQADVERELSQAGYQLGEKFPPVYSGYGGFLHTSLGNTQGLRSFEPGVMRARLMRKHFEYKPII